MDNLHRELAPVSATAWAQIEEEATRTLKRHLAGRRVVDVRGPAGYGLAAVGTGRVRDIDAPAGGVLARQRLAVALVELRAPFTLDRAQIDDVERGAEDADWQPVKDAARQIAFAEDRAIFDGYPAAGIERLVGGDIIWAPAISGAVALTTRGGDFTLQLGQDASIGYLSHTGSQVELYLQETLTFLTLTAEAAVGLPASG